MQAESELLGTEKLFYLTNGIALHWTALHDSRQHSTHHYSSLLTSHEPHVLCHYVAVNIMFSHAIHKEGTGKGFLPLTNVHHSHRKCSLHTDVLQVKLKILHPECAFSDHLPYRCLRCKVYPLRCPTSKNCLFHHQKHSGDNWKDCLHSGLLDCLAQRRCCLIIKQVFRKWSQNTR